MTAAITILSNCHKETTMYKINIITRSADKKQILTSSPVDQFSIITDKKARTAEVLDIEAIAIDALAYSKSLGFLQIQFVMGGVDKNGKFHAAPQYKPALFSINRASSPLWQAYELEDIKSFDFALIEKWLHENNAVTTAGANIWGTQGIESVEEKAVDK
jgi:hypothetical protein